MTAHVQNPLHTTGLDSQWCFWTFFAHLDDFDRFRCFLLLLRLLFNYFCQLFYAYFLKFRMSPLNFMTVDSLSDVSQGKGERWFNVKWSFALRNKNFRSLQRFIGQFQVPIRERRFPLPSSTFEKNMVNQFLSQLFDCQNENQNENLKELQGIIIFSLLIYKTSEIWRKT